jgi:hypothetical protein
MRLARRLTIVLDLASALAVMALAACAQSRDAPVATSDPRRTTDAHWRQVDGDVAAIINGMAQAHGGRVMAVSLPEQ